MSDLARRTLTVVVGFPLVVGWLWLAHTLGSFWLLVVPLGALAGAAAWEYAGLVAALDFPLDRPSFTAISAVALVAFALFSAPLAALGILAVGTGLVGLTQWTRPQIGRTVLAGVAGLIYLPFLMALIVPFVLSPSGAGLALGLTLLALVWSYDSGAYLIGSRWGQRRMAPQLSPRKSWEGAAGGLLLAVAIGLLSMLWLPWGFHGVVLAALVSAAAQLGDLFESWLKRMAGVKDAGTLFPGHGGVLDRMDALLFALPVFHSYLVMVVGWRPL